MIKAFTNENIYIKLIEYIYQTYRIYKLNQPISIFPLLFTN